MQELLEKYCANLDGSKEKLEEPSFFRNQEKAYKSLSIDFYDFIKNMHTHTVQLFAFSERLKDTNIAKIELVDGKVIFTIGSGGVKLITSPNDPRSVPFEMLHWGDYEKEERLLFDAIITDGMMLLDIGANLGWFSLYWSKKYSKSTIHAFEPIKETLSLFYENIALNRASNIHVHNLAVSETNGAREFFYSPQSSVLASSKNILGYKNAQSCLCETTTIDTFLESSNISQVDLIRVDVEGDELGFLQGAKETLDKNKPILVLELFHEWSKHFDYEPQEVIDFLLSLGYEAFLPSAGCLEAAPQYRGEEFERQNYFFLHCVKHKDLINRLIIK